MHFTYKFFFATITPKNRTCIFFNFLPLSTGNEYWCDQPQMFPSPAHSFKAAKHANGKEIKVVAVTRLVEIFNYGY